MAKYRTDFREYSAGSPPSDWTERWVTGAAVEVQTDGAATGGKKLRWPTNATSARRGVAWNAIDGDADRDDVDILCRMRHNAGTTITQLRLFGRGTGAAAAENTYVGGLDEGTGSGHRLQKYVAGTPTSITTAAFSVGVNVWFWTRFQITGTTIRVKNWTGLESDEPGSWDLSTTDASISGTGWTGLWNFGNSAQYDVDIFAVGTNGDVAAAVIPPYTLIPTIGTISPSSSSASVPYTGLDLYATGVEYRLDGGSWVDAATTNPISITGLTPAVEYDIELRAYNSAGGGTATSPSTFTTTGSPSYILELDQLLYDDKDESALVTVTGAEFIVLSRANPRTVLYYDDDGSITSGVLTIVHSEFETETDQFDVVVIIDNEIRGVFPATVVEV